MSDITRQAAYRELKALAAALCKEIDQAEQHIDDVLTSEHSHSEALAEFGKVESVLIELQTAVIAARKAIATRCCE